MRDSTSPTSDPVLTNTAPTATDPGAFSEMTANDQRVGWNGQWARKHYKQMIVVRALLAPWILFVTVFLCVKGYWWGLVFVPFLALDLWLLRSLVQYARTQGR
jgi:hypothetical protein